jgi:hypothetical protein
LVFDGDLSGEAITESRYEDSNYFLDEWIESIFFLTPAMVGKKGR